MTFSHSSWTCFEGKLSNPSGCSYFCSFLYKNFKVFSSENTWTSKCREIGEISVCLRQTSCFPRKTLELLQKFFSPKACMMLKFRPLYLFLSGMWVCDNRKRQFPLRDLCRENTTGMCEDKSDTSFCLCGKDKWICESKEQCIRKEDVCSGKWQCADGSDEAKEFCSNGWTCPDNHVYFWSKFAFHNSLMLRHQNHWMTATSKRQNNGKW